jgi:hypothetical protein
MLGPEVRGPFSERISKAPQIPMCMLLIHILGMVGVARFELATPAMSMQCSTAELYAHSDAAFSETRVVIQASNEAAGTFLGKHAFNF